MSKDHQSFFEYQRQIKLQINSELGKVNQSLNEIEKSGHFSKREAKLLENLNEIENLLQKRINYDFGLKFEVNGLKNRKIFSDNLHKMLNNSILVEKFGNELQKLSKTFIHSPSIMIKQTKPVSNINREIRTIFHSFYISDDF